MFDQPYFFKYNVYISMIDYIIIYEAVHTNVQL